METAVGPAPLRWEWRTFGIDFGGLDARIRAQPGELRRSAETYIVSSRTDANTKVRDQHLEIKALLQIDLHRLELWQPVLKAAFPLTPDAVVAAFEAWGLTPPALGDQPLPPHAFLRQFIAHEPSLTLVDVTKARYSVAIDGCLVEIADLTFDGTPTTTIAVEMADADRVWNTVQALGLATFENVNYVKALKRFLERSRSSASAAPGRVPL